jgi:capsular exopolysaccharide synthesis family protein
MSQIFDALQKSETERAGTESALPQGAELLRRAERDAASKWDARASSTDGGIAGIALESEIPDIESAISAERVRSSTPATNGSAAPSVPLSTVPEAWSTEERLAFFSKIQSIPVALEPEGRLVFLSDRESPTAEAVRLLSVRLRDLRRMRPLKKVLITSSIPREGKTTMSSNLSCALAHGGEEKVLVIEGDVRIPALRQMFGIERVPGLCEFVEEERALTDCIYHLDGAGLWILPTGRVPSNPLEVLQSPKIPAMFDQLAACFDWIIIDSPPVLPLADTSIWMRLADGILLVARQGVSEKQQLQRGLEALEPKKMLGALLNCAAASAYSGYYYRSTSDS